MIVALNSVISSPTGKIEISHALGEEVLWALNNLVSSPTGEI
jgi:hypothetical protein